MPFTPTLTSLLLMNHGFVHRSVSSLTETVLQKRRAVRTNPTRLDSLIGVYCYMVKFKALQISREHESQYLDEN